jgi:hypothetical protein
MVPRRYRRSGWGHTRAPPLLDLGPRAQRGAHVARPPGSWPLTRPPLLDVGGPRDFARGPSGRWIERGYPASASRAATASAGLRFWRRAVLARAPVMTSAARRRSSSSGAGASGSTGAAPCRWTLPSLKPA